MDSIITLIVFILVLGLIVLVHEFGHFFWSKVFGVYVHEFSIGMGPAIWHTKEKDPKEVKKLMKKNKGKRVDETMYSIRWIPIGGYCALAGEDPEMDKDIPDGMNLGDKPKWQRFIIMVFGATNNFILGLILILLMASIWGARNMDPIIESVKEGTPAYNSGIKAGDLITSVNGNKVSDTDELSIYLQLSDPNKELTITAKSDNKDVEYKLKPDVIEENGVKRSVIGVTIDNGEVHGFGEVIKYTFRKFFSLINQMIISFKLIFSGGVKLSDFSGPVGIYQVVGTARHNGIQNLLYLMALLTVNIGFMNLLPFPALDGGRVLLLIVEQIKGSPVSPKVENAINTVGFLILIGLMIIISISDILKFFVK